MPNKSQTPPPEMLTIAVPKGRVLTPLSKRLASLGVRPELLLADDRTLVREDAALGLRFLLLKPDDVPTYVEYGIADLGVVGRDILLEQEYDVYVPTDLKLGHCRLVVAGKKGTALPQGGAVRVATKFLNSASQHFGKQGRQIELIHVRGSVELAPITGLADVIVDLVESGETLRQNGLEEFETIAEISSVVIVNRVGLKLRRERIAPLLAALEG